jgi:hypothetical protein
MTSYLVTHSDNLTFIFPMENRSVVLYGFATWSVTLGTTHSPTQWVPGALSLAVKRLGLEADHSSPSSVNDKE